MKNYINKCRFKTRGQRFYYSYKIAIKNIDGNKKGKTNYAV